MYQNVATQLKTDIFCLLFKHRLYCHSNKDQWLYSEHFSLARLEMKSAPL